MYTSKEPVLVIGGGHTGAAFAAFMAAQPGMRVCWYSRRIFPFAGAGVLRAVGPVIEGTYPLECFSRFDDVAMRQMGQLPRKIVICCRGNDVEDYARRLARHVRDDMDVLLVCSSRFADMMFVEALRASGVDASRVPAVAATSTTPLVARFAEGKVDIRALKNCVALSARSRAWTERVCRAFRPIFPALRPVFPWLRVQFETVNDVVHLPLVLSSARSLEMRTSHLFYRDVGPRVVRLVEQLDQERVAIAAAYGVRIDSIREMHASEYGTSGNTLYEHFQRTSAYATLALDRLDSRYLMEDVPYSAVPLRELARKAGVATPQLDRWIELAYDLFPDEMPKGWTARSLGIEAASLSDVIAKFGGSSWRMKAPILEMPARAIGA